MRILSAVLCLLVAPVLCHAQRVSDSVVFRDDTPDSAFVHGGVQFDRAGAFVAKEDWTRKQAYFLTPQGRYGPFSSIGGESSTNEGSIDYTGFRREEERSGDSAAWYYWHGFGTRVHGPVRGEMVRFNTEDSREAMSLVVRVRDSLFYYVDGRLVGAGVYDDDVKSSFSNWCVFSPRGRALYQVPSGAGFALFLDRDRIDSSGVRFYAMSVDDEGRFLYASRLKSSGKPKGGSNRGGDGDDSYGYRVMLRTSGGDYGPLEAVETFNAGRSTRFARGSRRNGDTGYAFLDGRIYRGIGEALEVSLTGVRGAAFTAKEGADFAVYAGGRRYPLRYSSISHLTTDATGAFALTGMRNYYRYVVMNGTERSQPLSKHGARGAVLALDARGRALVAYRNDDSTWIYHDDTLLLTPAPNRVAFEVMDEYSLLRTYRRAGEPATYERPVAFRLGSAWYAWYRGALSPPLRLYAETTGRRRDEPGFAVEASGANAHGFFLLYRTGAGELTLNLNNRIFHTFKGIDRTVYGAQWLDDRGLVFYAVQGREFHRYFIQP